MAEVFREALEEGTPKGRALTRRIVDRAIEQAMAGDMRAIEFIFDRLDGKACQALSVGGEGPEGRPITMVLKEGEDVP